MSERTRFRPGGIVVDERALRRARGRAELLAVDRERLYGLALEFAMANADEFDAYVREDRGDPG